jgi:hypothetical protein
MLYPAAARVIRNRTISYGVEHSRFHRFEELTGLRTRTLRLRPMAFFSMAAALSACVPAGELSNAERERIERDIREQVVAAYDVTRPGAVDRMLSLYPARGPVYSAGAGRFTTSRDTLAAAIEEFWENVGRNMQQPRWEWTAMEIDVLSTNTAVMTATYRVPHLTPRGEPHVIGGAWTAVFARSGNRWEIVHEHLSDTPVVPAETARAAADTGRDAHAAH